MITTCYKSTDGAISQTVPTKLQHAGEWVVGLHTSWLRRPAHDETTGLATEFTVGATSARITRCR
jgi:hypothetical protein